MVYLRKQRATEIGQESGSIMEDDLVEKPSNWNEPFSKMRPV